METEGIKVNDRMIKLICVTYNVNENWLRSEKGTMFGDDKAPIVERAFSIYEKLNDRYQEYVFKQMVELCRIQEEEQEERTKIFRELRAEAEGN